VKPDIYICNDDASGMEERTEICKEMGIEMVVPDRKPKEGLEERSSTSMKARLREMVVQENSEQVDGSAGEGETAVEAEVNAVALAEVQAELASSKEAAEQAQQLVQQWTEYANGLTEEKTALEAEMAALKEQSTAAVAEEAAPIAVTDTDAAEEAADNVCEAAVSGDVAGTDAVDASEGSAAQQQRCEELEAEVAALKEQLLAAQANIDGAVSAVNAVPASTRKRREHLAALQSSEHLGAHSSPFAQLTSTFNPIFETSEEADQRRHKRIITVFHQIDSDSSGVIEKEELLSTHSGDASALLDKLDLNHDGQVSLDEWQALFSSMRASLGVEREEWLLEYFEKHALSASGIDQMLQSVGNKDEITNADANGSHVSTVPAALSPSSSEAHCEINALSEVKAELRAEVTSLQQQISAFKGELSSRESASVQAESDAAALATLTTELAATKVSLALAQEQISQWTEYGRVKEAELQQAAVTHVEDAALVQKCVDLEVEVTRLTELNARSTGEFSRLTALLDNLRSSNNFLASQADSMRLHQNSSLDQISALQRLSVIQQKRVAATDVQLADIQEKHQAFVEEHSGSGIHLKVQEQKAKMLAQTARLTQITMLASQLQAGGAST